MKTIMIAAAMALMLAPSAYAAAPVAAGTASKATVASQATKDGAILLAAGRNRDGAIGLPRNNGLVPGKTFGLG